MNKLIVTFFGLGYAPKAPGTFGALGACLLFAALQFAGLPFWGLPVVLLALFVMGALASTAVQKEWGEDNQQIVIDEVLGMGVSLLWVPFRWEYYLLAFALFRLFDIWKPLFIKQMENLPDGWGVMADDLLAGIYACLVLQLLLLVY